MEFVVDVVALQPLEKVQQRVAEYRPRPSFGICGILRDAVFDVVADTLEQRVEQVFLIFEMPIERAARYAGSLGDFVERGARNPFSVKGFQGGKQTEKPDGMGRQMPSENLFAVFRRHFVYRV